MQLARICLSFAALAAAFTPAHATETVSCVGTGNPDVVVEMNLGSGLPADRPNWVLEFRRVLFRSLASTLDCSFFQNGCKELTSQFVTRLKEASKPFFNC